MDTAAVSYRIVDFLKTNPPFSAMSDTDLLALTTAGRVKFYEANDFILWHGEPHKAHVFVIHQGTVSLWDDSGERATLQDVRGAGDLPESSGSTAPAPASSQPEPRAMS